MAGRGRPSNFFTSKEIMSQLPDYVASATPNPKENRVGWLTTTAASYAGVMLWFAFWQKVPGGGDGIVGGALSQGLIPAIGALVLAAFLCHFLFYLVPGMLGMKTGLPLAVVGTSTFGVKGGYIMPGFLMGALQFGWLAVNAYFAGLLLANIFQPMLQPENAAIEGGLMHNGIAIAWILIALFVGMKGARLVGAIASVTPILPVIALGWLLMNTIGGVGSFDPAVTMKAEAAKAGAATASGITLYGNGLLGIFSLICAYTIGFFATAGAAGVDFGTANKDGSSIHKAGLVGIVLATCFTGIAALLIVAGAQSKLPEAMQTTYFVPGLFEAILGSKQNANICMGMLVIASFPSACFPALVAASAFKTTFPKTSPMITCGIGIVAAIILCVTGLAGSAEIVFGIIGASFGPIVGAMVADYLLAGCKWSGPRAGFNIPGWVAWFFGFIVGAAPMVAGIAKYQLPYEIPCPPLSAFVVGFVLYVLTCFMRSRVIDMPQRIDLDVPAT